MAENDNNETMDENQGADDSVASGVAVDEADQGHIDNNFDAMIMSFSN